MPCRYRIDAGRGVVVSTAWGNLTFADMDAHQEQLAVDPLFSPEFNQLVDATAVAGINLSLDEAKKLAGRKLFSSTSRRAFLGSGISVLAAGRLMQAYAQIAKGRQQVSVFHERDAALKWLGMRSLPQKELPISDRRWVDDFGKEGIGARNYGVSSVCPLIRT